MPWLGAVAASSSDLRGAAAPRILRKGSVTITQRWCQQHRAKGTSYRCRQQNVMYLLKLTLRPPYQYKGQEHSLLDTNSSMHIKDFEKQLLEMSLAAQGFQTCSLYLPTLKVRKTMREINYWRNSFNKTFVEKTKSPR